MKSLTPVDVHRHLEVYRVRVDSQNEAWIWCSASDNLKAHVADKQLAGRPRTSAAEDCRADAVVREGGHIKLVQSRTFGWLVRPALPRPTGLRRFVHGRVLR